jgi:hypothetical protein
MSKRSILNMNAQFGSIKPAAASRHILALTGELETLAVAKKPATQKPAMNRRFLFEAMISVGGGTDVRHDGKPQEKKCEMRPVK